MRVEYHNRLGDLVRAEVTRVVVSDDLGNPISVSFLYQPGHAHTCHVKDPEFKDVLRLMGVDRVVSVEELSVEHTGKVPTISRKPMVSAR